MEGATLDEGAPDSLKAHASP